MNNMHEAFGQRSVVPSAAAHRPKCAALRLSRQLSCCSSHSSRRVTANQRTQIASRHSRQGFRRVLECRAAPEGTGFPAAGDVGQVCSFGPASLHLTVASVQLYCWLTTPELLCLIPCQKEELVGEDAAYFDVQQQSTGKWVFFTVELAVVLGIMYVVSSPKDDRSPITSPCV
jgi:hypothetical protein